MELKDFSYSLPFNLIAQEPMLERDRSNLMLVDRAEKTTSHYKFFNLLDFLKKDDFLIFNDTKVFKARLIGNKKTGSKVEIFLLKEKEDYWEALVRPSRRLKHRDEIFLPGKMQVEIVERLEGAKRLIKFKGDINLKEYLEIYGEVPLPPYIKKDISNLDSYQTIYAKYAGSVAAPTAGLHFTHNFLKEIEDLGVRRKFITLHIGLGTFKPIKVSQVYEHIMEEEYFQIKKETLKEILKAKKKGQRIISVGTTTTRALESINLEDNLGINDLEGFTNLFIYPGFKFKIIDALVTNFHLPQSTLFILTCAFGGKELIFKAYREAIFRNYRFYSFGDAMFII